ncbi:DNA/RNA helicase domain-containing protein [Listeria aquatica]|uniref:DNA/RNA helicase domain-containing protein n=1 Tax=Listeria aquatica TaxID=1494960 RepID=UPI0004B368E1|nr:DNA/RNA helicase domain-containing protein [Listeria aquatica]
MKELNTVIIDEAQRIRGDQLKDIIEFSKENSIQLIFSMDENQCLSDREINGKNKEKIIQIVDEENRFRLKDKIRTNPEIADFIKNLFTRNPSTGLIENPDQNIQVKFFGSYEEGEAFINKLETKGWESITYATSTHSPDALELLTMGIQRTSHKVIGQEFDKVVVVLDSNFKYIYDDKNIARLTVNENTYYHAENMLLQNLTRTRRKLFLVIIENKELFVEITKLLKIF